MGEAAGRWERIFREKQQPPGDSEDEPTGESTPQQQDQEEIEEDLPQQQQEPPLAFGEQKELGRKEAKRVKNEARKAFLAWNTNLAARGCPLWLGGNRSSLMTQLHSLLGASSRRSSKEPRTPKHTIEAGTR